MHPDLAPCSTPVWAPWRFNLGDHWATMNYLLTRSWMLKEVQQLSRYQHGQDFGPRFHEILDLLNPPERACVEIVDAPGVHEPDGFSVWASPFWPTKKTWSPLGEKGHVVYQFDGISSAEDKNPPAEDIPHILDALPGLYFPLGRHQSLAHCVDLLASARAFIGCDSGMSHLAHSVGVPMILVEYKLPIITTHRRKHFVHCRGTEELIWAIHRLLASGKFNNAPSN